MVGPRTDFRDRRVVHWTKKRVWLMSRMLLITRGAAVNRGTLAVEMHLVGRMRLDSLKQMLNQLQQRLVSETLRQCVCGW